MKYIYMLQYATIELLWAFVVASQELYCRSEIDVVEAVHLDISHQNKWVFEIYLTCYQVCSEDIRNTENRSDASLQNRCC
jgi:hypothetical protein